MKQLGRLVVTALAVLGVATACSSGSGSSSASSSASSSGAPEDQVAAGADVVAGLQQIDGIAANIADVVATDKAAAKDLDGEIEPIWKRIEGTVKRNDQDAYIGFEDAFALLGRAADAGDGTKAREASTDVTKLVTAYVAAHPT